MAFQLIRHDEPMPPRNIVTVIFGEPGVGKTSLAFTALDPILWAFDRKGVDRAVGRKDAIIFTGWTDVIDYMDSNEIEKNKYITGIIDTGGMMLDEFMAPYIVALNEKYGNGLGGLGLQGYGVMKDTAAKFFTKAESKGLDLIFICHTQTEKEGDQLIRVPKMTGGAQEILIAKADLIGYMEMKNNKITLEFSPTSRHAGKNCARFPVLEIPHFETAATEYNGYMAGIIKKTKEHLMKIGEAQAAAVKLIASIKEKIEHADTFKAMDDIAAELDAMSPIYKAQGESVWNKKYAAMWSAENFNPEETKTPEQFKTLAARVKLLPKPIAILLQENFKSLLQIANLEYDKIKDLYVPVGTKTVAPAVAAPAKTTSTIPSTTAAPPAATPPTPTKVYENKSQEWFTDRIGFIIKKASPKFNGNVIVSDMNDAEHFFKVLQNMKSNEFEDSTDAGCYPGK